MLRYDGETGAFIDNFVIDPLSPRAPAGLVFGPDGNLYLSIFVPIPFPFSSVLRYNGTTGLFIDDFVPTGIGGLSGATYLTFTPPVVQADQDEDGISNEVDGEFVGGAFTDESNLFSDHFTDQHLGGTSFGFIVDRGGLTVTVEDATNPAGLLLGASGAGGGTATVNACGIPLELTDGDSVEITCGSLTTVVLVGPIEILLDQDVVAIVPGGATATVTVVEGQFDVENSAESTAAIIVQVRGQIIELAPGSVASLPLIISSPVRIERASVKRDKKGRPDKDKFDFEGRLVLTDFAPDDEPVIVRLLDVFEETVPRGSFVRKGKKLDKLEFKAPRRTSGITKRSRSGMTDGSKSRLRTWT